MNGCLLSSFTTAEQVTALHLVSEYIILGTTQGNLHIRDLYRCRSCSLQNKPLALKDEFFHSNISFSDSLDALVAPQALQVSVRSVSVTKECSHILVGLEDGKLIVVGAGKPEEVRSGTMSVCEMRKWGGASCLHACMYVCGGGVVKPHANKLFSDDN